MEDKRYDPYTGYEIKEEDSTQKYNAQNDNPYRQYRYEDDHTEQPQQEQTSGDRNCNDDPWNIAVVCMVSCCCTPLAIILGIAAIICFIVTPKVNETRGTKSKAGLICGIYCNYRIDHFDHSFCNQCIFKCRFSK